MRILVKLAELFNTDAGDDVSTLPNSQIAVGPVQQGVRLPFRSRDPENPR